MGLPPGKLLALLSQPLLFTALCPLRKLATISRAIIRNPNYLPAHRELAVVYSELGQEKEAGAEAVEVLRISPNFSIEVLRQRLPFKNQAESERYLAALRKAGLK